jgi:hypothetical protein
MDSLHFTEQDKDLYKILGTTEDTSHEEASRIYRKLCKTWHPNKNSDAPSWVMAKILPMRTPSYTNSAIMTSPGEKIHKFTNRLRLRTPPGTPMETLLQGRCTWGTPRSLLRVRPVLMPNQKRLRMVHRGNPRLQTTWSPRAVSYSASIAFYASTTCLRQQQPTCAHWG